MKLNGYMLREALRNLELRKDMLRSEVTSNLYTFAAHPPDVVGTAEELLNVEKDLAEIQSVQARYNCEVSVIVEGRSMKLIEAVKLIGGASRMESLWRKAAETYLSNTGRGYGVPTKVADSVEATRTLSAEQLLKVTKDAVAFHSALRSAIAEANSRMMDMDVRESIEKLLIQK